MIAISFAACAFMGAEDRAAISDADGDGFLSPAVGGDDCDDTDAAVGGPVTAYDDLDGDGFGVEPGRSACEIAPGLSTTPGDCDDSDPNSHPGALPGCSGRDDRDCDGVVDTCVAGEAGPIAFCSFGATDDPAGVAVADVDGDGVDDAWIGCPAAEGGHAMLRTGPILAAAGTELKADDGPPTARIEWLVGDVGRALAAQDLDGDDVPDLLLGAPSYTGTHELDPEDHGALGISLGPPYPGSFDVPWMVRGEPEVLGLGTGLAVLWPRDEPLPTILVGASGGSCEAAYVLPGLPAEGASMADAIGAGALRLGDTCSGEAWGIGTALGFADVFSRDGRADLLIGAPGRDATLEDIGAVYVVNAEWWEWAIEARSGRVELAGLGASPDGAVIFGDLAGDAVGTAVASGDFDGDGADELLIGVPGLDFAADDAGAAYAIGQVDGNQPVETNHWRLDGGVEDARAGTTVAAVPDIDGDGRDEILVGAPGDQGGTAWLYRTPAQLGSASLPEVAVPIRCPQPGCGLSAAMAGGDFDADGRADAILAAPHLLWELDRIPGPDDITGAVVAWGASW